MNVSDLLNSDLKTMCVAFFNITGENANGDFVVKSEYRDSQWATILLNIATTDSNNMLLNQRTALDFSVVRIGYHEAIIENDLNSSLEQLFDDLYVRIESFRNDSNFKADVLLSCFALRGSYDPTGGWYAVDLYSSNEAIANYKIGVLNLVGDSNIDINPERDFRNKQIRIRLSDFKSELQLMQYWNIYKYSKHPKHP